LVRYRALLDVGATFLGSSNSEELYRAIYTETAKVIEFTGFFLSLYDAQTDVATVVLNVVDGEETEPGVRYRGSDSEVLRRGTPTAVEHQTGPCVVLFPEDNESDLARSTLSVPLLCRSRVTAALTVYTRRPEAYDPDDAGLLRRVADVAAVALENMRHIEELRRRSRDAEKLEEIGRVLASSLDFEEVLERVSLAALDLLHLDGAGVWTHEKGCATVSTSVGEVPVPVGTTWVLSDALAEAVIGKGRPFVIEDASADENVPDDLRPFFNAGSAISTPIVMGDRVLGALSARSRQVRRFTEYDVGMLVRLAGQATVALDNAELHASIQALSLTDSLTGLPNRRHLELHLGREFAAAGRGRELVLVMFDLDGFKHYNDTLGHVVGDQILREFGAVLAQENRAMNLVARFGGDEFVSVLSESDANAARGYQARIYAGIESNPYLAAHGVTVSSGISEFTAGETLCVEDLIQAADRRMYKTNTTKS
jgi:diguanylate cyclase (GGDEF)-like protein